jgi:hypothetical protein
MLCKLCRKEVKKGEELCRYHSDARSALKNGYSRWKEAYSGMPWDAYLNRVKTAEGTGEWVKQVITLEEGAGVH